MLHLRPATLCEPACNPTCSGLQPYVLQVAVAFPVAFMLHLWGDAHAPRGNHGPGPGLGLGLGSEVRVRVGAKPHPHPTPYPNHPHPTPYPTLTLT
eukprot:scaffold11218_cov27-Phaeocystis_antarctica.AAC.1